MYQEFKFKEPDSEETDRAWKELVYKKHWPLLAAQMAENQTEETDRAWKLLTAQMAVNQTVQFKEKPVKKLTQRQLTLKKFEKKKWFLFGQKFNNFYSNIFSRSMLLSWEFELLQFKLHKTQIIRDRKDVDYNGWIDLKDGSLSSVWHSLAQCKMCISSNYKEKEKQRLGLLVRLTVKSVGIILPSIKKEEPVIEVEEEEIFSSPPMRRVII